MDAANITLLLQRLGCSRVRVKDSGWVVSTCPFARWTHGSGVDSHPSFAVRTADGQSGYRCLGCHLHGTLAMLPFALQARGYPDAQAILRFIQTRDVQSLGAIRERVHKAEYKTPPKVIGPKAKPLADLLGDADVPVLPDSDLLHFGRLPEEILAKPVLAKRKIAARTYEDWQIRWHPWEGRIAIPTRDHRRRLVGIAGRVSDDKVCFRCEVPYVPVEVHAAGDFEDFALQPGSEDRSPKKKVRLFCPKCERYSPPKYLHTKGFSRDNFLFGEHLVRPGVPGVLVEGQFDTVALRQWGYNALGIMGTWLSEVQIAKVCAWCPEVTFLHETDKAGVSSVGTIRSALASRTVVKIRALPDGRDADELEQDEVCDILGPPPPPMR